MNILFLNSIDSLTYGGMEEWIRLVACGLVERGFGVHLIGRNNSEFLRRVSATSEKVRTLGMNISGDFDPVTINRLRRFISENEISTVFVNFNKDLRLGGLAAKLNGSARVIWSVGLDITKDNLAHKLLTPMLCDGVIVPSESLKKQICRHGYISETSVRVIPIGIPELQTAIDRKAARKSVCDKYGIDADSLIAVTSGRFVTQKGHRYLIEAAPAIVEAFPNIVFLLLGDGDLRSEIEAAIIDNKLKDHFVLAGMLDDFQRELAASDLMIHPSIEEPFGIVLLEGMRASLPIVASDVGGIPDVVEAGKCALLVPAKVPEALATAVIDLLGSETMRVEFGAAGLSRLRERFGLESMIDSVADYINEVLKVDKVHGSAQGS